MSSNHTHGSLSYYSHAYQEEGTHIFDPVTNLALTQGILCFSGIHVYPFLLFYSQFDLTLSLCCVQVTFQRSGEPASPSPILKRREIIFQFSGPYLGREFRKKLLQTAPSLSEHSVFSLHNHFLDFWGRQDWAEDNGAAASTLRLPLSASPESRP